jgi:hypothetical protein
MRAPRAEIDGRNTDESRMTRVALCSKSFIAGEKQLVAVSSSTVHEAAWQQSTPASEPRNRRLRREASLLSMAVSEEE